MVPTTDGVSTTRTDEVSLFSSDNEVPAEEEEIEETFPPVSADIDEEEKQSSPLPAMEQEEDTPTLKNSVSISSEELEKETLDQQRRDRLKFRSVSFAPMVEEIEIPSWRDCSFSSTREPIDITDVLIESYLMEIGINSFPLKEEKRYVPKTSRTRLNPNWREHRIRRLMNKLEELSLWDREEELKVTQAQFLREQKLEQIHDRQRNHDLCLHLMRQRHESEMESTILLDRAVTGVNDENTGATLTQAKNLASSANVLTDDVPILPYIFKRRVQDQEKLPTVKTPLGRYRQFETKMTNKLEKINQKLPLDWEIMRAYNPYRTSIPATVVPLFSETYTALVSVPDTYSSNRYNQYHYGIASYLHQSSPHASSPDYETRLREHSNRDVRVPLKEQMNDSETDDYNHSQLSPSPTRRPINSVSSTNLALYDYSPLANSSREFSFIHSPQPISNSIHQRSLNDDLNAITSKHILRNMTEFSNGLSSTKTRSSSSSSIPTNKRVTFIDQVDDNEDNFHYQKPSRMLYQPEMITLASTA